MHLAKRFLSALLIIQLAICGVSGPYRTAGPASDAVLTAESPAPYQAASSRDDPSYSAEASSDDPDAASVSALPEPEALSPGPHDEEPLCISTTDAENFGKLLTDFVGMFEARDNEHVQTIEADLNAIKAVSSRDHDVASSIAAHWLNEFLRDDYQFCNYKGGNTAPELASFDIPERGHAIVVLGYALADGQMQSELIRRCNAAAAFARTYPSSIIVCTGGATGANNPENNTEAGLMKKYLSGDCGIDASRIYTEDQSMDTRENAENTLNILQENGIKTMTIVTSDYHQRRAQELYYAAAQLFRVQHGYTVEIKGNFCCPVDPEYAYSRPNGRLTILQIAEILGLPEEIIETLPQPIYISE